MATQKKCLSFGNTGIIELLAPGDRVKKSPHPHVSPYDQKFQIRQLRREVEVYQRLPPHDRLIRMLGYATTGDDPHIVFEYMPNGSLSSYLEAHPEASIAQRLRWSIQAAEAVALLHWHNIIHADIRPDNMVLDNDLGLKLIDLAGAAIDGNEPLCLESSRFFLPRNMKDPMPCNVHTDLFALGSSIYHILTGLPPYHELSDEEVELKYKQANFPSTEGIICEEIIRGCWMCSFDSAEAIIIALVRTSGQIRPTWPLFPIIAERICFRSAFYVLQSCVAFISKLFLSATCWIRSMYRTSVKS